MFITKEKSVILYSILIKNLSGLATRVALIMCLAEGTAEYVGDHPNR